jgi:hypothetical protein
MHPAILCLVDASVRRVAGCLFRFRREGPALPRRQLGAHFRWDFNSSVLVHRTRTPGEALNIWRRNRRHVPFYPSMETAAEWRFNGSRLNDWRMIDVETGGPVYLPAYNATL